jgi:hypothetical protein
VIAVSDTLPQMEKDWELLKVVGFDTYVMKMHSH